MSVPDWWEFTILALASFRIWKLAADDLITDEPREWLLARLSRFEKAEEFIGCPWCLGFWIAVSWWLAWLAADEWATGLAVPFALSAVVGVVGSKL